MNKKNYLDAIKLIKESETIAILMHTSPDGDSIGSSLAVYSFLKNFQKTVHCFSDDLAKPVSDKLSFLPYSDVFNKENLSKYDLAITLDCGDDSRLGKNCYKLFINAKKTLLVDHHLGNQGFADVNIIEPDSASTTQIIYKLLTMFNDKLIDKNIATLLYAGLITDSGSFIFPSTSAETHYIASKLIEKGAESAALSQRLLRDVEFNVFKLKAKVLNEAKFYDNNTIGVISTSLEVFKNTNTNGEHTEGIINDIINIDSVLVAISITEIKDKAYKVSFRSKNDISAELCAKCFGGGGHKYASGCRIYGYFDDVMEKVLIAVRDIING